jgi:hypothetical protein
MSFMRSVTNKPIMLSVFMLCDVILNVVALLRVDASNLLLIANKAKKSDKMDLIRIIVGKLYFFAAGDNVINFFEFILQFEIDMFRFHYCSIIPSTMGSNQP